MCYNFLFSGFNVAAPALCLKCGQHPSGHHSPRLYLQGDDALYCRYPNTLYPAIRLVLEYIGSLSTNSQPTCHLSTYFSMLSKGWHFLPFQNLCKHALCSVSLWPFSPFWIAGFFLDFRILALFSLGLCRHFVALPILLGIFCIIS